MLRRHAGIWIALLLIELIFLYEKIQSIGFSGSAIFFCILVISTLVVGATLTNIYHNNKY
ncbi:hypothetical protein M5X11_05020 [Paenibacillus alginolyticus]|uniref:hypothetical protein n=1 Tax=Paenibacillus alginolyticus TaxID=59839 RepID=UPI000403AFCC|nr:hypothetical protein [Paenibacillus alginolyticus]MCY9664338.1 hypothetical protein [Paenibacillus alginolyticus]